jgi:hypothetical protein
MTAHGLWDLFNSNNSQLAIEAFTEALPVAVIYAGIHRRERIIVNTVCFLYVFYFVLYNLHRLLFSIGCFSPSVASLHRLRFSIGCFSFNMLFFLAVACLVGCLFCQPSCSVSLLVLSVAALSLLSRA